MTYSFHPEAEDEFNKAVEYYEEIEPGLGYDFAVEVYSANRGRSHCQRLGLYLKVRSDGH
jgi:hypothetical protein